MSGIFPLAAFAVAGWLGGMLVNALADWLAVRRDLVGDVFRGYFGSRAYLRFLLFPVRANEHALRWRLRVAIVALLCVGASLWLGAWPPPETAYFWSFPLLLYLLLVTVMDVEHKVILFPVAIAGGVIGLLVGTLLRGWQATLLGGLGGFVIMLALFWAAGWIMKGVTRLRGDADIDEVPLGFGDVNLSGVMGLLLGWPGVLAGLTLTILLGGIAGILFIIGMRFKGGYTPYMAIPYGPNLVLATIMLLFFRGFL